jgi:16S rRNA (guanine527-N7)-methyltransferase
LAIAYRATFFTLVDAQQRRLDWVASTAAKLRLANLTMVHARLEDYARGSARAAFDVTTARALGALPVVAELGLPLLKIGGQLLVPRGQPDADELEQVAAACEQLGGRLDGVVPNPSSPIDRVGFVVIMAKIAATSPRFPRRSSVPARTPLGQLRKDSGS